MRSLPLAIAGMESEADLVVGVEPIRTLKSELFFQKYTIARSGIKLLGDGRR